MHDDRLDGFSDVGNTYMGAFKDGHSYSRSSEDGIVTEEQKYMATTADGSSYMRDIMEGHTYTRKTKKGHYCNSMPLDAAWAYYGKVLVLANVAS